jgi:hypothetical protein
MSNFSRLFFVLVLTVATSLFTACSRNEEPRTFEDCLLEKTLTANTVDALTLLKAACKGKFPKIFDFDAIASGASVSIWREVALKSGFSNLQEAEKSEARKQYFESVVMPRVDQVYLEDAITQFDAYTRKIERAASASATTITTSRP